MGKADLRRMGGRTRAGVEDSQSPRNSRQRAERPDRQCEHQVDIPPCKQYTERADTERALLSLLGRDTKLSGTAELDRNKTVSSIDRYRIG